MLNLQHTQASGALSNRAHAIAIHLHRDGVRGVCNQQRPGIDRADLDYLPHQTTCIDQRLADKNTVVTALVEYQLVAHRVGRNTDQLGYQHVIAEQGAGVEQCPQAHVLGLQ